MTASHAATGGAMGGACQDGNALCGSAACHRHVYGICQVLYNARPVRRSCQPGPAWWRPRATSGPARTGLGRPRRQRRPRGCAARPARRRLPLRQVEAGRAAVRGAAASVQQHLPQQAGRHALARARLDLGARRRRCAPPAHTTPRLTACSRRRFCLEEGAQAKASVFQEMCSAQCSGALQGGDRHCPVCLAPSLPQHALRAVHAQLGEAGANLLQQARARPPQSPGAGASRWAPRRHWRSAQAWLSQARPLRRLQLRPGSSHEWGCVPRRDRDAHTGKCRTARNSTANTVT